MEQEVSGLIKQCLVQLYVIQARLFINCFYLTLDHDTRIKWRRSSIYEVLLSYCIAEDNNNSDLSNDREYSNSHVTRVLRF